VNPGRDGVAGGSRGPGRTATAGVLGVLCAFDGEHPRMGLSEIARRAALPLTTTHRLVGGLVAAELLIRGADSTTRWVVGSGRSGCWHLSRPGSATPHPVHAGRLRSDSRQRPSRDQGRVRGPVCRAHLRRTVRPDPQRCGRRLPLHATGVGKILLAYAPQEIVDGVLRSPERVTKHTIVDAGRLRREMQAVRERGFARTARR
jgi:Transcriptional regulator